MFSSWFQLFFFSSFLFSSFHISLNDDDDENDNERSEMETQRQRQRQRHTSRISLTFFESSNVNKTSDMHFIFKHFDLFCVYIFGLLVFGLWCCVFFFSSTCFGWLIWKQNNEQNIIFSIQQESFRFLFHFSNGFCLKHLSSKWFMFYLLTYFLNYLWNKTIHEIRWAMVFIFENYRFGINK